MSDEFDDSQKTEEPTPRKLEQAREKGNVATSREVGHWMMFLSVAVVLSAFAPSTVRRLTEELSRFLARPDDIPADAAGFGHAMMFAMGDVLTILMPIFIIFILAAAGGNLVQHGVVFSAETIKPSLNRISPLAGFKRLFSVRSVVEFLKSLGKVCVVSGVAIFVVMPALGRPDLLVGAGPVDLSNTMSRLVLRMTGGVLGAMTFIAGLDLLYQRLSWWKRLRMSKQELKDEFRNTEGDPMVRARQRSIRMERSRRRMMQQVPKADVVIANPTHFAVALKYDMAKMGAPTVVAKGMDGVALKIRAIAEDNKVPVVENPPLARALHASVDIDQEIPPEHYKAVAEVISWVFKLKNQHKKGPVPRHAP